MPPKAPGVCVLFTEPVAGHKNYAFVCRVSNLRARRHAWEFHFRNRHNKNYTPVVARSMPDLDGDQWRFRYWTDDQPSVTKVTELFRAQGYEILSNELREKHVTHAGKTGTLAQLCREFGVDYQRAYYRLNRKGDTIAEIFGG